MKYCIIKESKLVLTNIFYEKIFDVNANNTSYLYGSFKMLLETDNTRLSEYITISREIFDEFNNRIYSKSSTLNKFKHLGNNIIINTNIVYYFKKDIKKIIFKIYFRQSVAQYLNLYYTPNKDYRFIMKHYSL